MDIASVRSRIAAAVARAGRAPDDVRIVAVTKGHPLERAQEAVAAGLADLGENRVQEALAKQAAWPEPRARWHLIGHLQRNKAKLAVGRFVLIHSLDSVRLADALEAAAAAAGLVQELLIEVNVAREPQKSGALPEEAEALVAHAAALPHLRVRGLMAMAPYGAPAEVQHRVFGGLRRLRDALATSTLELAVLSMGMSGDFEIAVEEGATMVRLGTILFGERAS
jgi:pyridoxal phosphate enzyme (YggS family)